MRAFIYVLHFEGKLAHAAHYTGSTISLRNRLVDHANGFGSAICRHLKKIGAHWHLSALYECKASVAKRIERRCKDHHNAAHWCPECVAEPYTPPACVPYDLSLLRFEPTSQKLRSKKDYSFEVRLAKLKDCEAIRIIQKQYNTDLGFIPIKGPGGFTIAISRSRVIVAVRNGVVIGFTIWTENDLYVTIHQTAVHHLCQLQGIGRELVQHVIDGFPEKHVRCGVREDLPANFFWEKCGFLSYGTRKHRSSGSTINLYQRNSTNGI